MTPVAPEDEAAFGPIPAGDYVGFRLAFYDIETTDLGAFIGRMICATVGDSWGNLTTRTILDFSQTTPLDDSGLAEWLRDELERYDISVGWNNFQFDLSFLNARLLRWGKRPVADRMAVDAMWKASYGRYGARIGSRKLVNVQKFFRVAESKTELDFDVWALAGMGDKAAMAEVVAHCEADVLVTRSVFNHLKPLIRTIHR